MNKEELGGKWQQIVEDLSKKFGDGETLDVDSILFLIGVQELGLGLKKFKKDEKINLMHVAICSLLQPYGYYNYIGRDDEGWPHFELVDTLPALKPGEQSVLMKQAIIKYFDN